MNLFSENIKDFEGKSVKVNVIHKIYGEHQIKIGSFQPLFADGKIGFITNGHEIFSRTDEIEIIQFSKNVCKIIGKLQTIIIKK